MGLMERDYIREKNKKSHSQKWNSEFGSKKTIESELDRICEDKRKQKEYKKQLFNQNIKPHLVYMDENGNIEKKVNSHFSNDDRKTIRQLQKQSKIRYARNKFLHIALIFIIIFLILYLSYDLYMSSTMTF